MRFLRKDYLVYLSLFLIISCAEKDDKDTSRSRSGANFFTKITPIVDQATPDSFKENVSSSILKQNFTLKYNEITAADNLSYFFNRSFTSLFSGEMRVGTIRGLLMDLDDRLEEVESALNPDNLPACLDDDLVDFVAATGDSNHQLALKFSCFRSFYSPGDMSGEGSGIAYGKDDDYHYISLILTQKDKADWQRSGFFAKVHQETFEVELIFMEHFNNDDNSNTDAARFHFFHILADPENELFEFAASGSATGYGPDDEDGYINLFRQAHVWTDGTNVIARGEACNVTPDAPTTCPEESTIFNYSKGNMTTFSCYSAADFSDSEDCDLAATTLELPEAELYNPETGEVARTTLHDSVEFPSAVTDLNSI